MSQRDKLDKLGDLIYDLQMCAYRSENREVYKYFGAIKTHWYQSPQKLFDETERHILSNNFLYQRAFSESDRNKMIHIIRQYKLYKLDIN